MTETSFHIKGRKRGKKKFYFVSPRDGGLNALRIHASIFPAARVEAAIAALAADNPEFEFKKVAIA